MSSAEKSLDKRTSARSSLLIAGERLFTEKGYAAVSTRELADAAGVNLGAIQYHFGSKAKLFIETLQQMMCGSGCMKAQLALEPTAKTREEALFGLGCYIRDVLHYMLRPEGPQVCRLMFREILSETAADAELFEPLVESMVEEFIKPVDGKLRTAIKMISPQLNDVELAFAAKSVVGQCSFYVSHQPFIERLDNKRFSDSPNFEDAVCHIFRFTARALGVEEQTINAILPQIFEQPAH